MKFFTGLHHPSDAQHFKRCFISINAIRDRKSNFKVKEWIMDSAGFTELHKHGEYRDSPETHAAHIRRWGQCGRLLAAVTQDYMCEPVVRAKTGLTVADHQRLTIQRYDAIRKAGTGGVYLMPVLQGWMPQDYVNHIRQYGQRLKRGAWVGVGSICKRQGDPAIVKAILRAIHAERPDLQIHAFGLKITALQDGEIVEHLHTGDSMSWSFHARINGRGRDANDWREADRFRARIEHLVTGIPQQIRLIFAGLTYV